MADHELVDYSRKIENVNHFSYLAPKNSVDIKFEDLTYNVPYGRKTSKVILDGVCGKFISGQLTAILGPSGAGKTTLLNMLAGLERGESSGTILVNGLERNVEEFKKISRYITQNDYVQPYLTVEESMIEAANLKLGSNETRENKSILVHEIINLLKLNGCENTLAKDLSGGERKRLSIALELIDNPPVIFLDEPTTGLDDVAGSQCISLLKNLADAGRTVICALHTPSARLFSIFDQVYIINEGQCVYQGYGPSVIDFLENIGLKCPPFHNPADFMIEVCKQEHGDFQNKLVSMIENGRLNVNHEEGVEKLQDNDQMKKSGSTFFEQIKILAKRMYLQTWRHKGGFIYTFLAYLSGALLMGNIFLGTGNDGSKAMFNFGYLYISLIYLLYVSMMPLLLHFPIEMNRLKREHFNKWYGLGSYYTALMVTSIPLQMFNTFIYFSITYSLTDQPMEIDRMIFFYLICLLTGLVSESIGLMAGAVFNVVNAHFVGTALQTPCLLLGFYGYGSGLESIPGWIRFLMSCSYMRYSIEGLMSTMFRNRSKVPCPEDADLCIYTDVNYFMKLTGMENAVLWRAITGLLLFLFVFRIIAFYLLKQRLTPNKISRTIQSNLNYINSRIKF